MKREGVERVFTVGTGAETDMEEVFVSYSQATLSETKRQCVVDTAANKSCVGECEVGKHLNGVIRALEKPIMFRFAGKETLPCAEVLKLPGVDVEWHVIPQSSTPMLLGLDYLEDVVLDLPRKKM